MSDEGPELLIDVKLSQEEWGDLVGTTRESVNKQFRTWTSEGLIALEKGRVENDGLVAKFSVVAEIASPMDA